MNIKQSSSRQEKKSENTYKETWYCINIMCPPKIQKNIISEQMQFLPKLYLNHIAEMFLKARN